MSSFLSKALIDVLAQSKDGEKPDEVKAEATEPTNPATTSDVTQDSATTAEAPQGTFEDKSSAFSSIDLLKKHNIFNSTATAGIDALKQEDSSSPSTLPSMGSEHDKAITNIFQSAMSAAAAKEMVVAATDEAFNSVSWKDSLKGADGDVPADPSVIFQSTTDGSSDSANATAIASAATATAKPPTDFAKLMESKLAPFGKRQIDPPTTTNTTDSTMPQPAVVVPPLDSAAALAAAAAVAGIGPNSIPEATPPVPATVSGMKRSAPVATTTTPSSVEGGPKNFIKNTYTDNDVLMGKGGRSNHHPGNQRYLRKKLEIQPRYRAATKEQKTSISQELVDSVHSWGGRFLKMDETTKQWYMVDNKTARKKASQTLREDNTPQSRAAKRAKYDKRQANKITKVKQEPATAPAADVLAVVAAAAAAAAEPVAALDPATTIADQTESVSDAAVSSAGRAEALAAAIKVEGIEETEV